MGAANCGRLCAEADEGEGERRPLRPAPNEYGGSASSEAGVAPKQVLLQAGYSPPPSPPTGAGLGFGRASASHNRAPNATVGAAGSPDESAGVPAEAPQSTPNKAEEPAAASLPAEAVPRPGEAAASVVQTAAPVGSSTHPAPEAESVAAHATGAPAQAVPDGAAAGGPPSSEASVQHLAQLPGRRRSLLVGINYIGTSSELSGCVNDVRRVQPVLKAKWGFPDDAESQRVLLDEPGWECRPTLANMRAAIRWLVQEAQTGDALYLHYSGHGGRMAKADGDGYHETLCPVDYETAGMLVDTEMFEALVQPLPAGCRLTCVLDCCHSAGALDLPYVFLGSKENLDKALAGEAMEMAVSKSWGRDLAMWQDGNSAALIGDFASMGLGLWELYRKRQESKEAGASGFGGSDAAQNKGLAVGEVIAFTGCRSDQTSADVGDVHEQFAVGQNAEQHVHDHAGGALTAVFLESIEDTEMAADLTYLKLLERMRQRLQSEGFEQVPQLASSLVVELKQRFSLTTAFLPPHPGDRGVGASLCGTDAVDGAIAVGGAACAAGFLAALASAPHGAPMMQQEYRPHYGWADDSRFCNAHIEEVERPYEAWGSEPRVIVMERPFEEDRGGAGEVAQPLHGWGGETGATGGFMEDFRAEPETVAQPLHSFGGESGTVGGYEGISAGPGIVAQPIHGWGGETGTIGATFEETRADPAEMAQPLHGWGGETGTTGEICEESRADPEDVAMPLQGWGAESRTAFAEESPASAFGQPAGIVVEEEDDEEEDEEDDEEQEQEDAFGDEDDQGDEFGGDDDYDDDY